MLDFLIKSGERLFGKDCSQGLLHKHSIFLTVLALDCAYKGLDIVIGGFQIFQRLLVLETLGA